MMVQGQIEYIKVKVQGQTEVSSDLNKATEKIAT